MDRRYKISTTEFVDSETGASLRAASQLGVDNSPIYYYIPFDGADPIKLYAIRVTSKGDEIRSGRGVEGYIVVRSKIEKDLLHSYIESNDVKNVSVFSVAYLFSLMLNEIKYRIIGRNSLKYMLRIFISETDTQNYIEIANSCAQLYSNSIKIENDKRFVIACIDSITRLRGHDTNCIINPVRARRRGIGEFVSCPRNQALLFALPLAAAVLLLRPCSEACESPRRHRRQPCLLLPARTSDAAVAGRSI